MFMKLWSYIWYYYVNHLIYLIQERQKIKIIIKNYDTNDYPAGSSEEEKRLTRPAYRCLRRPVAGLWGQPGAPKPETVQDGGREGLSSLGRALGENAPRALWGGSRESSLDLPPGGTPSAGEVPGSGWKPELCARGL